MKDEESDPKASLEDLPVDLDEEQLAQIDALIEQRSTAEHRLTREEVIQLLLKQGVEQVKQAESLLPYLLADEGASTTKS